MSIKIMSAVWEYGPDDKSELLVLLALADHANDAGECWPSMARIGSKSRMAERSARRVVRELEAKKYLKTELGGGRGGANKYTINPDIVSGTLCLGGGQNGPKTRTNGALNPDTAMSAEPSRTFNNLEEIYSDLILRKRPMAASQISPSRARELVTKGYVTEDQCREAGVVL